MTQDDRQEHALHPSLHQVLRLEIAQAVMPLGPEYHMWVQALNRQTQIFVDGNLKGPPC